jgi:GxxExxY protein
MENIFEEEFNIINTACSEVRKILGIGFTEKIYEEALAIEIEFAGLRVESQKKLDIYYKGKLIGNYLADMVINDDIVVEFKREEVMNDIHTKQLLNSLAATDKKLGILINFPYADKDFEIIRVTNIKKY